MYNITHDDYMFINLDDETHAVELLTRWVGVQYQYDEVSIEEKDDHALLSFTWKLVKGDESLNSDSDFQDFQNYIGDVLSHIISDLTTQGAKVGRT